MCLKQRGCSKCCDPPQTYKHRAAQPREGGRYPRLRKYHINAQIKERKTREEIQKGEVEKKREKERKREHAMKCTAIYVFTDPAWCSRVESKAVPIINAATVMTAITIVVAENRILVLCKEVKLDLLEMATE